VAGVLAAVLNGPRDLRVTDVPKPELPDGWVLVKTAAVGICGTDKAFYLGTYPLFKKPLVPGHEAAGEVVEGSSRLKGRLVVPEINFPCWRCETCREGLYTHCPSKKTLGIDFDGAFAEFFAAPVEALHTVEGLDPVLATEVEPLAALLNALRQVPLRPGDSVAVIGTGNLAVMLLQLLKHLGFEPVVVVRRGSMKIGFVERYAVEVVFADELREYVNKRTRGGMGFDTVFEVSGDPSALELAVGVARPRGVVHLKSTPGSPATFNSTVAVVKEVRIVGTRCGSFREFREAIDLLKRGFVKPEVTAVIDGLPSAPEAFEKSLEPEQVKVVVRL
jgi:alcohol dehydrogenase